MYAHRREANEFVFTAKGGTQLWRSTFHPVYEVLPAMRTSQTEYEILAVQALQLVVPQVIASASSRTGGSRS